MKYNKYSNKKVTIDGYTFDSKKEANRYIELKLLSRAGKIKELTLQPKFELQPTFKHNGTTHRAISYIADFKYVQHDKTIIEDIKGFKTDLYRLKKKMLLFRYPDIIFVEL